MSTLLKIIAAILALLLLVWIYFTVSDCIKTCSANNAVPPVATTPVATTPPAADTNTLKGLLVGATAGLVAGESATAERQKQMLDAGIEGLASNAVAGYQNEQEDALRKLTVDTGIEVQRHGDNITLKLPDGITFDTGKAELNPALYPALDGVIKTLGEYKQTIVEVTGHTDNTGSHEINQPLSEQRALSVASYLTGQGVQAERIETLGAAEYYPIADNATDEGRAQNRRVEIRLIPLQVHKIAE